MKKGILTVVEGDATDPKITTPNEIVVIPHVCNDIGGWGRGFVLALSKKWVKPQHAYRSFYKRNKHFPLLGKVCYAKVDKNMIVANMIAQHGTVCEDNPIPIKYKALVNCMAEVLAYITDVIQCQTDSPVVIHCPKFGSELAKGDWNFILELIREIWLEAGIDVVVYEFKG